MKDKPSSENDQLLNHKFVISNPKVDNMQNDFQGINFSIIR